MKKRIAAIIGIVILVSMYLLTLIFAIIGTDAMLPMLKASIAATIIIPVFIYIWLYMVKILKNKKPLDDDNLIKFDNKASVEFNTTDKDNIEK